MKKIKPESVKESKVLLQFETGRTVKELGEILNFSKGTYIKLEHSQKGVIPVRLNDIKIANGKLLTNKGELYVQITDLIKK